MSARDALYIKLAAAKGWTCSHGGTEDDYRATLERHGAGVPEGKDYPSAATMTVRQLQDALAEFEARGFVAPQGKAKKGRPTPRPTPRRQAPGHASPEEVARLRALWLQLAALRRDYLILGAVHDSSEQALRRWCSRQLGLRDDATTAPELLTATKVERLIEALKGWGQRLVVASWPHQPPERRQPLREILVVRLGVAREVADELVVSTGDTGRAPQMLAGRRRSAQDRRVAEKMTAEQRRALADEVARIEQQAARLRQ